VNTHSTEYIALSLGFNILVLSLIVATGIIVHKDAKQRGLDAFTWTVAATLIPYLIGLVVYLFERRKHPSLYCPTCGASVKNNRRACLKCAATITCDENHSLPIQKEDRAFLYKAGLILAAALVMTLLQVDVGRGLRYSWVGREGLAVEKEVYQNYPAVMAWMSSCDEESSKVYAIFYQTKYDGPNNTRYKTQYLVYSPDGSLSIGSGGMIESNYRLFGRSYLTYRMPFRKAFEWEGDLSFLRGDTFYTDKPLELIVSPLGEDVEFVVTEINFNLDMFAIKTPRE